jgi:hypothetical protein
VCGGDWNATYSTLPVEHNPDVLYMQNLPNLAHSKLIREMCDNLNLIDPFRVMYPNLLDFSYAPWGNSRKNRSRIDFFIVSKSIVNLVSSCHIKPAVQSKLFDHKAVLLDFNKKKARSSRPTISNKILCDPDVEIIGKLASFECYALHLHNNLKVKGRVQRKIGLCFKLLREAGPDPRVITYSHATTLDLDTRDGIMTQINGLIREIELEELHTLRIDLEADMFLEFLMNNFRNEIISYQSFI